MKTVHNFIDVHKMKPVGLPVFGIISDDKSVVTEITDTNIVDYSIDKECVRIVTSIFYYVNNPDWDKSVRDTTYTVTLNQNFIDPHTGETILLVHPYENMVHSSYNAYGSSVTKTSEYTYYFEDKNAYDKREKSED